MTALLSGLPAYLKRRSVSGEGRERLRAGRASRIRNIRHNRGCAPGVLHGDLGSGVPGGEPSRVPRLLMLGSRLARQSLRVRLAPRERSEPLHQDPTPLPKLRLGYAALLEALLQVGDLPNQTAAAAFHSGGPRL